MGSGAVLTSLLVNSPGLERVLSAEEASGDGCLSGPAHLPRVGLGLQRTACSHLWLGSPSSLCLCTPGVCLTTSCPPLCPVPESTARAGPPGVQASLVERTHRGHPAPRPLPTVSHAQLSAWPHQARAILRKQAHGGLQPSSWPRRAPPQLPNNRGSPVPRTKVPLSQHGVRDLYGGPSLPSVMIPVPPGPTPQALTLLPCSAPVPCPCLVPTAEPWRGLYHQTRPTLHPSSCLWYPAC